PAPQAFLWRSACHGWHVVASVGVSCYVPHLRGDKMADVFDFAEEKFLRIVNGAMKLFVVEYSVNENTTSIRTLENVLRDNYKKICNGVSKDYLPVGIFKSREDADRFELHFQTSVVP